MAVHIVLVGYGATGRSALRSMADVRAETRLIVLDNDVSRTTLAAEDGADPVLGDGRDVASLQRAGVPTAAKVVISVADDAVAAHITMVVRQLNDSATVVTALREPRLREPVLSLGADQVVVREHLTGWLMGKAARRPDLRARLRRALEQPLDLVVTERAVRASEVGCDPATADPKVFAVVRDGVRLWRDHPEVGSWRENDRLVVLRLSSQAGNDG